MISGQSSTTKQPWTRHGLAQYIKETNMDVFNQSMNAQSRHLPGDFFPLVFFMIPGRFLTSRLFRRTIAFTTTTRTRNCLRAPVSESVAISSQRVSPQSAIVTLILFTIEGSQWRAVAVTRAPGSPWELCLASSVEIQQGGLLGYGLCGFLVCECV